MVAPEFQIVDETSVAGYLNFMERTIEGDAFWLNDLGPDYSDLVSLANDVDALLDRVDLLLTANQLRPTTRENIVNALNDVPVSADSSESERLRRVHIAIMLTMASLDYLIQK